MHLIGWDCAVDAKKSGLAFGEIVGSGVVVIPLSGFKIHHKKLRTLDSKAQVFKRELKRITRRCPGISIESRIRRLREYAQGWMGHYGCGLKYDEAIALDGWIRRRLRSCYWTDILLLQYLHFHPPWWSSNGVNRSAE